MWWPLTQWAKMKTNKNEVPDSFFETFLMCKSLPLVSCQNSCQGKWNFCYKKKNKQTNIQTYYIRRDDILLQRTFPSKLSTLSSSTWGKGSFDGKVLCIVSLKRGWGKVDNFFHPRRFAVPVKDKVGLTPVEHWTYFSLKAWSNKNSFLSERPPRRVRA